jgi:hypothetical protein
MAEQLVASSIAAPGFMGVNTQDSSVTLESGFATQALNCVIDKFGRIGARKGWTAKHASNSDLSTASIKAIGELIGNDGTSYTIVAGNNKLFKLSGSTLSLLTYGGGGTAPTITDSNWQMAALNNVLFLYQAGHDPLIFDPAVSATTFRRVSEKSGYLGTVSQNNTVIAAYGRTWSANNASGKSTIQFSDLLAGHVLTTGSAGSIDVSQVWPNGSDEIVALAAHNGYLYVFGRRQILIYAGAKNPLGAGTDGMYLQDHISGIGCCARDSVVVTGSDVIFLSDSGLRSMARTVQEKSAPMRDISANVRDDLVKDTTQETLANIKAVYSDVNAFYLITFPSSSTTYCFDMRKALPDGSARVTTWSLVPTAMFSNRAKELLTGHAGYVGSYLGNLDRTSTYRMAYYSNHFDLGTPSQVKILKKVGFTIVGASGVGMALKYGFDYTNSYRSLPFYLGTSDPDEYGVAEYGIAEYESGIVFDNQKIQAGGSGNVLQIGLEVEIEDFEISVQKLDVFAKVGKTR